jgi:NAD(P)-dependent dehydrogenase (short-subunit alcohol dehydrogenase family)
VGYLDGKVAVITGAGSGMAKASVKLFASEGARVVAADMSGAEKDTAAEVGAGVLPVHCDVTKEDDVAAMIDAAMEEFGRVDAVLNVAGIGMGAPIHKVTMEQYDTVMDVDLRGVMLGMKYGIQAMLNGGHGGAIVNWSSVGGLNAAPYTSVYSAAKAGVIAVTKAAAVEYGAKGIRANAICPGFILTEIMGAAGLQHDPGMVEKAALGRAGEAHEVAEVAAFLASDKASFVSGAIIPVDGGWSCRTP